MAAVVLSPKGIPSRLPLTPGVINRATVVLFLVTGVGKAQTVRAILPSQIQAERALPAVQVKPDSGRLLWLLDNAATAALTR